MRARGGVTTRRVLAHPGWLAVVALAVLASLAVTAVLDAGLRVWSTNAGVRAGHVAVIGAPLPGPAVVTVPARPARRHPVPVQQPPATSAPLSVAPAGGAAAAGTRPAPATVSRPAPAAPTTPDVPPVPPALLTLVAPLAPPIRVVGMRPLALRALVLRRQAEMGLHSRLRRQAWSALRQAEAQQAVEVQPPVVDEQPAVVATTSTRAWAPGWSRYRQAVRTSSSTTSTPRWSAHTWHAWR